MTYSTADCVNCSSFLSTMESISPYTQVYIVNLVLTGLYLFFLFLLQNIILKIFFSTESFSFLQLKNRCTCILNGQASVHNMSGFFWITAYLFCIMICPFADELAPLCTILCSLLPRLFLLLYGKAFSASVLNSLTLRKHAHVIYRFLLSCKN